MRRFLQMLLAVLLCTTAMCTLEFNSVYADSVTSADDGQSVASSVDKLNDNTVLNPVQDVKSTAVNTAFDAFSNEEVYLVAQLVHHEAHNQAYNGKVAIAEVVLNRINSRLFPNTIDKVVFQSGQFTSVRRIKNISPTEEEVRIAYNVLNGTLRVLKDSNVLYFRNPKATNGLSAKVDKNWGSLDYYTYIGDHAFYSQENKNTVAAKEEEKTGFFGPTSMKLANLFGGKKNDKAISEEASAEVKEEKVEKADETVIIQVENNALDNAPAVDSEVANNTEADIEATNEAVEPISEIALASEDSDNEEVEESVSVDSEVLMGQASPLEFNVENDEPEITVGTEAERSAIEEELDDLDEDDPIAIARRRALMDQKAEVERKAREIEIQNAANASAQNRAVADEKAEVEKIARLMEESIKATQAAVEQAKAKEMNK